MKKTECSSPCKNSIKALALITLLSNQRHGASAFSSTTSSFTMNRHNTVRIPCRTTTIKTYRHVVSTSLNEKSQLQPEQELEPEVISITHSPIATTTANIINNDNEKINKPDLMHGVKEKMGKVDDSRIVFREFKTGEVTRLYRYVTTSKDFFSDFN